jgi:sulfur-carrier protein adenylyltransferase/sulfurtransferase
MLLLSGRSGLPLLLWLCGGLDDGFIVFSTVCIDANDGTRLPGEYVKLADKKVCVIGCGSIGSKVATSLARSGIGTFELIDDDLFMSENLVRNELDWRDMGLHKIDALARRLALVNPRARVTRHKVQLDGQEASSRVAGALRAASSCDLIIDATCSPAVFNLVSAITVDHKKPLIWGEVLGGGLGGLIARYVPGRVPTPPLMRQAIVQWCNEKAIAPSAPVARYDSATEEGEPLLAADSDVSVIAAHLARTLNSRGIVGARNPGRFAATTWWS